jgi:putative acetyltransferase
MMESDFTIRKGQLTDLIGLQRLFVDTIHEVCRDDYTTEQMEAWTYDVKNQRNQKRWEYALVHQYFLVAHHEDQILGFASLEHDSYVDFLYVHKDFQGQGVASALYSALEKEAVRLHQTMLTSDVSKTARPFFERTGFEVTKEQMVLRRGVELTNYKMKKALT